MPPNDWPTTDRLDQPELARELLVEQDEVAQVVDLVDGVGVAHAGAGELRRVDGVPLGQVAQERVPRQSGCRDAGTAAGSLPRRP